MKNDSGSRIHEEVSIMLGGDADQGIQTVEHILTQTLIRSGYHVFSTEEYMSRIRGGCIEDGYKPISLSYQTESAKEQ